MRLEPLLLALALTGCFLVRSGGQPAIPERAANGRRVFVVVAAHVPGERRGSNPGAWWDAAWLADRLHDAGFRPWIVKDIGEVPGDAPLVEKHGYRPDDPIPSVCTTSGWLVAPPLLTFGIIPGLSCEVSGIRFDFRRTPTSPPQVIDTRFGTELAIGWLLAPLALSSSWSFGDPENQPERESRALRAALVDALEAPR